MIVSGKKERRYLHAEDEMQAILIETGLAGASLRQADARGSCRRDRRRPAQELCSIWSSASNKGCEPLAAATAPSVTFWQWRIILKSDDSPPNPILAMACFRCSWSNTRERKSGFIVRKNV